MATNTKDLLVKINGDTSGLEKALGKSANSSGKLKKAFQAAEGGSFMLMGGLTAAAGAAVVFGAKSVGAFNASVEASTKLRTNMLNVKGATEGQVASLEKLAGKMQNYGVIEDDVIKAGMSQLATFDLQASTIEGLTPKIADMVTQLKGHNATAEDMVGINNLVGKVMTGNVGSLSRYGVTLDENQKKILQNGTETEKMNTLNKVLAQNYGEVNKALRNTPQGQITAFKNTFGDFMEVVGEFVMSYVGPLVQGFNDWMESMGGPTGMMEALVGTMEKLKPYFPIIAGAILGGLLPAFVALGASIWTALAPLLPFIAVGAALGFLAKLLMDRFGGLDGVMKKIKPVLDVVGKLFNEHIKPALQDVWTSLQKDLLPALQQLWKQIKPILIPVLKVLGVIIGAAIFGAIMIFLKGIKLAIKIVSTIINWFAKLVEKGKNLVQWFRELPGKISSGLGKLKDIIVAPFKKAFDWIKGLPGRIVGAVGNIGKLLKTKLGNWDIPGPLGKVKDVIPGFQQGGFTGRGAANEIAGVVHRGEYVIPKDEVDQFKGVPKAFNNNFQRSNGSPSISASPATVINFNPTLQVGMFAGMPTEYRQISERLWVEFTRIAKSNGVKLQNIGVNVQ